MEDIISVINTLAQNIFSAVEVELFDILDNLVLIDTEILSSEPIEKFAFKSENNSIALLSLTFITMFVICFTIRKLISMYGVTSSTNTAKFILRIVVCTILMASSYYIIYTVLDINKMFGEVLINICEEVAKKEISFVELKELILELEKDMTDSALTLDGAIKGMVSFGVVSLVFTFAVRYVTVIVLIILSPIAFMLAINDSTMSIFIKWCKLFITNIFIQNIVILVITIPLCMDKVDTVMFKVILVGSIYILYKINNFVKDIFSEFNVKRGNNEQ